MFGGKVSVKNTDKSRRRGRTNWKLVFVVWFEQRCFWHLLRLERPESSPLGQFLEPMPSISPRRKRKECVLRKKLLYEQLFPTKQLNGCCSVETLSSLFPVSTVSFLVMVLVEDRNHSHLVMPNYFIGLWGAWSESTAVVRIDSPRSFS